MVDEELEAGKVEQRAHLRATLPGLREADADLYITLHAIEDYILQECNFKEGTFYHALHMAAKDALALARGEA